MILGLLITILLTFFNYIVGLLPTASLDSSVTSGITSFVNYIYQFNTFFPVDTAVLLLKYTAAFWLLVFTFDFFKWIIHLIRGN